MSAQPVVELDPALRALADGNRRAILAAIGSEPLSVGAVAETVRLSQQTTSHHLTVLREAGLATGAHEGTRHLVVVRTDGLAAVRSSLDDFWSTNLSALDPRPDGTFAVDLDGTRVDLTHSDLVGKLSFGPPPGARGGEIGDRAAV